MKKLFYLLIFFTSMINSEIFLMDVSTSKKYNYTLDVYDNVIQEDDGTIYITIDQLKKSLLRHQGIKAENFYSYSYYSDKCPSKPDDKIPYDTSEDVIVFFNSQK